MGYEKEIEGYRLRVKSQNGFKVIISRNIIFNENDMPYNSSLDLKFDEPALDKETILENQIENATNQDYSIEVEST